MNSDDIRDCLLKILEVFPLPEGFKGNISFVLDKETSRLNLVFWFNHNGEVKYRVIVFDRGELITPELLQEIKQAHESDPLGVIGTVNVVQG